MTALHDAPRVGIVGSPSTNDQVEVDLLAESAHEPIVGQMLFLVHQINTAVGHTEELGLGVVTSVEQTNQFHANPNMRAAIKRFGSLGSLTGDDGDARHAAIKLQAAYSRDADSGDWRQAGNGLGTAPPTGALIRKITNEVIEEVVAGTTSDLHYLGHIHGSAIRGSKVRAPMSMPDFAGADGAWHVGFFGTTGSGKSQMCGYVLAGQMRHTDLGVIIVDPQGQWAAETQQAFSLQGWAQEMGRQVVIARISEDLRLEKDAPLFTALLGKTKFTRELLKMAPETQELLLDEIEKILKNLDPDVHDWTSMPSANLLDLILDELSREMPDSTDDNRTFAVLRRVYADPNRQMRLWESIQEIRGSGPRKTDVLRYFGVIHNLFQDVNPAGKPRASLWNTVSSVFDRDHDAPAPLLILDMSTSEVGWLSTLLADDEQADALDALGLLDQDPIKASILLQVGQTMKRAAEAAFRKGGTLNTQIVIDEAWRFLPPPHLASTPEVRDLSTTFGGYAKDWRKFGLGLAVITQSPRSINQEIWDQLAVRVIGYGLGGPDLEKVAEHLDERDHLRLYKAFAPPRATNPRVYPFLLMGPVSPLSFTKAPIAVAAYTDFNEFRADNHHWIQQVRGSLGKPILAGNPTQPGKSSVAVGAAKLAARAAGKVSAAKTREQAEQVKGHRDTGGVDMAATAHLSTDDTFSDPLGDLFADEVPAVGPSGRPVDPDTGREFPF